MKIAKCDRCGKIFDPSPNAMISDDGISITYPIKLTFETICLDCLKRIQEGDKDESN